MRPRKKKIPIAAGFVLAGVTVLVTGVLFAVFLPRARDGAQEVINQYKIQPTAFNKNIDDRRDDPALPFNTMYSSESASYYFGGTLSVLRKNTVITRVERLFERISTVAGTTAFVKPEIYIHADLNGTMTDKRNRCVYADDSYAVQELFSHVLYASHTSELPFGAYAGVAESIAGNLGLGLSFTAMAIAEIKNAVAAYPDAVELSYPLFLNEYAGNAVRLVKSLAYAVAQENEERFDWVDATAFYAAASRIAGADRQESDLLSSVPNASLKFPVRLTTASANFYFVAGYTDRFIPEFSSEYRTVKAYVLETERNFGRVRDACGITPSSKANIFIDHEWFAPGAPNVVGHCDASGMIEMLTVYIAVHEYTHFVLFGSGVMPESSVFHEGLPGYFSLDYQYYKSFMYHFYKGQYRDMLSPAGVAELDAVISFYEERNGVCNSEEAFDIVFFWVLTEPYVFNVHSALSATYYFVEIYGMSTAIALYHADDDVVSVLGKTENEVSEAYLAFIEAYFNG
ncbi:MAG: hypothetical protein LBM78_00020 [Clostridiales bacterium]|jgi:hypothetical protein|nr:hypothetical protein [Clostridiales bacterium]